MAIFRGVYGKTEPEYEGCVLYSYEHNGAWDSDWYAVVWDEKEGRVKEVEYDTTRAGGGGWCEIDATDEVMRKVYRYYFNDARKHFDSHIKIEEAKRVRKGDEVTVVRGRKVKKGMVGEVFWVGNTYNPFVRDYELRAGIKVGEEKFFLPVEYLEYKGWEERVATGKERKERIRKIAKNALPIWGVEVLKRAGEYDRRKARVEALQSEGMSLKDAIDKMLVEVGEVC